LKRLPEEMRIELKSPFGELIRNEELDDENIRGIIKDRLLITCGDETTKRIHEMGFNINIAIIDFKTHREEYKERDKLMNICERTVKVDNAPATISSELEDVLMTEIKYMDTHRESSVMIEVTGEEDLAFIPCVLYSPDNKTVVMYGQPNEGLVLALVDDELKNKVMDIYDRMETLD
jgi:uncharacterized protein (UPF0218 family)